MTRRGIFRVNFEWHRFWPSFCLEPFRGPTTNITMFFIPIMLYQPFHPHVKHYSSRSSHPNWTQISHFAQSPLLFLCHALPLDPWSPQSALYIDIIFIIILIRLIPRKHIQIQPHINNTCMLNNHITSSTLCPPPRPRTILLPQHFVGEVRPFLNTSVPDPTLDNKRSTLLGTLPPVTNNHCMSLSIINASSYRAPPTPPDSWAMCSCLSWSVESSSRVEPIDYGDRSTHHPSHHRPTHSQPHTQDQSPHLITSSCHPPREPWSPHTKKKKKNCKKLKL